MNKRVLSLRLFCGSDFEQYLIIKLEEEQKPLLVSLMEPGETLFFLKKKKKNRNPCLEATLAGARGLHVGFITFFLADSAFHHDATLGPPVLENRMIMMITSSLH
jgi:hypothetical protein